MDETRQPTVDVGTWEILLEVYTIVAGADGGKTALNATDVAYITGQLKTVLILNSLPAEDSRSDPKILDRLKRTVKSFKP